MIRKWLIMVVLFLSVVALLMGYDMCIISTVLKPIEEQFNLCPHAEIGSLAGGIFSDLFGRRQGLMLSDMLIVIGSACFAFGTSYAVLMIGRFVAGAGIGVGFVVFATFIPEIAPAKERGKLTAVQECAFCMGCLISYTAPFIVDPHRHWRVLLSIVGIFALIQFLLTPFLPESPRWLIRRNRHDDAIRVMEKLLPNTKARAHEEPCSTAVEPRLHCSTASASSVNVVSDTPQMAVQRMVVEFENEKLSYRESIERKRLERIKKAQFAAVGAFEMPSTDSQQYEIQNKEPILSRCLITLDLLWEYRRAVGIAVGCAFAQNLTVSNSVLYFSLDIFEEAGVLNPTLPGIGILSAFFLVDKVGRRCLLLWGSITICICLYTFSLIFALTAWTTSQLSWLAVINMFIYIFAWNISWAGLMFVVAAEVLPSSIRAVGMGLTVMTFWLLAFLFQSILEATMAAFTSQEMSVVFISLYCWMFLNGDICHYLQLSFRYLISSTDLICAFLFFGTLSILSILFVFFFVKDYTGVNLEDIDHSA